MTAPALSVIVPTRDRPELVAACVGHLRRQALGGLRIEVLVVDDGSAAGPPERLEGAGVRVLGQRAAGLNAARNRGAEAARSPLLAYLDDDTVPHPRWAAAMAAALQSPRVAGAGGRLLLGLPGPAPAWLSGGRRSFLGELDLGPGERALPDGVLPVGANCALRRAVWEHEGGFVTGLDRAGGSLLSNGETELYGRLRDRGHALRYVGDALAVHRIPPGRMTLAYLRRRARAQGVSDAVLRALRDESLPPSRDLLRAGRALPILAKALAHGRGPAPAVLWLEYCRGLLEAAPRDPQGVSSRR